ncbi:MAG: hypothetical protein PGN15_11170 [Aeromicrobium erythreum]
MKMPTKLATAAMCLGTVLTGSVATAPTANAAGSYHGCPYQAVCMYSSVANYNNSKPISGYIWYSYAGHNISGQYGTKVLVNNQSGDAATGICAGSTGQGGFADEPDGTVIATGVNPDHFTFNATPVNSIDMRPANEYAKLCTTYHP